MLDRLPRHPFKDPPPDPTMYSGPKKKKEKNNCGQGVAFSGFGCIVLHGYFIVKYLN